MEELRALTKNLMEELVSIKIQLNEVLAAPRSESHSSRTYASVLADSVNSSSSASQPQSSSSSSRAQSPLPGVTVDTRRVRDKSKIADAAEVEENIRQKIQVTPEIAGIAVTGIQIRGHHVRVLARTEKDAALLRTHDQWVNHAFEGARTRGED